MSNDITEDYVSFETAKLLKEKGFKHWCYKSYGVAAYHKGVPISFDEECELKSEGLGDEIVYVEGGYLYDFGCDNRKKNTKTYAAPTLSMAMKWLREYHGLHIRPDCIGKKNWAILIQSFDGKDYPLKEIDVGLFGRIQESNYPSYEIAVSAAIKYCLENLI